MEIEKCFHNDYWFRNILVDEEDVDCLVISLAWDGFQQTLGYTAPAINAIGSVTKQILGTWDVIFYVSSGWRRASTFTGYTALRDWKTCLCQ